MARKKIVVPVAAVSTDSIGLRRTGRVRVNVNSNFYLEKEKSQVKVKKDSRDEDEDSDSDSKENISDVKSNYTKKSKFLPVAAAQEDYRQVFAMEDFKDKNDETENGIIVEMNRYYPFPMKSNEIENREQLFIMTLKKEDVTFMDFVGAKDYIKIVEKGKKLYLYLVLKPKLLLSLQPSELKKCRFISEICNGYLRNRLHDGYVQAEDEDLSSKETKQDPKLKLSDTFDYPEAIIPSGFVLELRDYQLRSISWMKSVENINLVEENRINNNVILTNYGQIRREYTAPIKIKLGDSGCYLNVADRTISNSAITSAVKPFRVRGGILADDTGSGKTVTCLGLIHSFPMTREIAQWRFTLPDFSRSDYVPSRASCVICPSNLHHQWIEEARRCNPDFKIVGLSCMRDHENTSWRDVMFADIVVISYQFLANNNYYKLLKEFVETSHDIAANLDEFLDVKGRVDLEYFHFYRVIFDEIHEMRQQHYKCKSAAGSLKADFYWGITGTPPDFNSTYELEEVMPFLQFTAEDQMCIFSNGMAREEFVKKFVKRNVPELKLPKLTTETLWVTATPSELALMNMMGEGSNEMERIMMCSHYQICEKISKIVGEHFKTIHEVKSSILDANLKELAKLKAAIDQKTAVLEEKSVELQAAIMDGAMSSKILLEIKVHERNLENLSSSYKSCESKCNYFKNVFELLARSDETTGITHRENSADVYECLICRDQIKPDVISILPCAHLFCFECISGAIQRNSACPLCRESINPAKDILRIRSAPVSNNNDALSVVDTTKYGSKLIALYTYITDLIRNSPDARIILFLQYRTLTEFISKTLNELNIQHVRVAGSVFQRKKSIESFKTSASNRVIILSCEDSVSGINLTEATHIIFLHPFWTGCGDNIDLKFEKQGISRAYRGGLKHPLKVVRFAVRGTIEEEITMRREQVQHFNL